MDYGSIMLILQKSLLEQEDAVPMLSELDFTVSCGMLEVLNPPTVDLSKTKDENLKEAFGELSVEELLGIKIRC